MLRVGAVEICRWMGIEVGGLKVYLLNKFKVLSSVVMNSSFYKGIFQRTRRFRWKILKSRFFSKCFIFL